MSLLLYYLRIILIIIKITMILRVIILIITRIIIKVNIACKRNFKYLPFSVLYQNYSILTLRLTNNTIYYYLNYALEEPYTKYLITYQNKNFPTLYTILNNCSYN